MSRVLCLAQAHAAAKPPRSKSKRRSSEPTKPQVFTMLERAPMGLAAHKPVFDVLRKHATRQAIIDDAHPGDPFQADVVPVDRLGAEAIASIASVLAERRATVLSAQKDAPESDPLAKRLDRLFEQEMEWLLVRNLLVAALRTRGKAKRGKQAKALLLIDA